MELTQVTNGVFWLDVAEVDLRILCGCPADVVKHLMIRGFMVPKTKNGVPYESGPNAILLSDVSIQNGQFSNLAEFPILQMFYRQGTILPGHPNNTGRKPLLIGHPTQISSQSEYITRGKYGLMSVKEITEAGIPQETAEEYYREKLYFAFESIKKTEDLIDFRLVENEPVEIADGVWIRRKKLNVFDVTFRDETVTVDLNLAKGQDYLPAVNLDFHKINKEYFSVIHIGDGDGWDVRRPCMSSLVVFQGKIYLIDTGPNILASLTALGISVNEIEGIFHTHIHDDHFAGLTSLVRTDHRIKYFATSLVRASVIKKLTALMSISVQRIENSFQFQDLEYDTWNNIQGLEVMPIHSPHPVETSVFQFRSFWEGGYKTYSHLADIPSLDVLDDMMLKDVPLRPETEKVYRTFMNRVFEVVNLKKIDIGGGMIHGRAEDFVHDKSSKILLSHIARELTTSEKEIGSYATFGQTDVLIRSNKDYSLQSAAHFLKDYFPTAPHYDVTMLLNCSTRTSNAGEIIIKKGEANQDIFLILSGVVEYIDSRKGISNKLSVGSFLGELSVLKNEPSTRTFRAVSHIKALQIPKSLYLEFVRRNFSVEDIIQVYKTISFLQDTNLFGEMVSSINLNTIARSGTLKSIAAGDRILEQNDSNLVVIKKGEVEVFAEDALVDRLEGGDFFGEENLLLGSSNIFKAVAVKPCEVMSIPAASLKGIPIVEWKILEQFERRLKAFGASLA